MTTEILGLVSTQNGSESLGYAFGPVIDAEWTRAQSVAHEKAGFDRVLIGYSASSPDGFAVASAILNATERLKVLIAHRPSALAQVNKVLFMRDGRVEAFGPRDEVLAKITNKPTPIRQRPSATV